jgi:hypothetical protein
VGLHAERSRKVDSSSRAVAILSRDGRETGMKPVDESLPKGSLR